MKEIRRGNWTERNWRSQIQQVQLKSRKTEFCKIIAENDGIILDVASGPGGGKHARDFAF
jgi:hypothetical protein